MVNNTEYYTVEELLSLGFKSVGTGCKISRKASFYAIDGHVGSNVRIDDFCVIKGKVLFGSYIHLGSYTLVSGMGGLAVFEDCSTLSSGVHVYTASDDYRANALSSSAVPNEFVKTIKGDVKVGKGVIVGAHSLLLPNTHLEDGVSVGAYCLVHGRISEGSVLVNSYGQTRFVKKRNVDKIIELVKMLVK